MVTLTNIFIAACAIVALLIAAPLTLIAFAVLLVVGGLFALCGSKGWDNTINQVEK